MLPRRRSGVKQGTRLLRLWLPYVVNTKTSDTGGHDEFIHARNKDQTSRRVTELVKRQNHLYTHLV